MTLEKLMIKNRQGLYALPIDDILYMEKELRKIKLHTAYTTVEFYGKFDELMPFLDERFLFCHRSYIINMDKIIFMGANQIFVNVTGGGIPFGHCTFCKAKKIFAGYLAEKAKYPTEKAL